MDAITREGGVVQRGERLSLSKGSYRDKKQAQKPKGHEAFLKALETSGATIYIEYLDSDPANPAWVQGVVKHSDKYTISLKVGEQSLVVFKHAIRFFSCADKAGE